MCEYTIKSNLSVRFFSGAVSPAAPTWPPSVYHNLVVEYIIREYEEYPIFFCGSFAPKPALTESPLIPLLLDYD